jgi:membrane protease YdiL (CAAX protease family)
MPRSVLTILTALRVLVSPVYTPGFELLGLAGLFSGYLEEIGWTGFVTPRLLVRRFPLAAGILLGALWGLWHGLADYLIRGHLLDKFWPMTFTIRPAVDGLAQPDGLGL